MDGDSSEDDCNFTNVIQEYDGLCVAHHSRKESDGCAFLRFVKDQTKGGRTSLGAASAEGAFFDGAGLHS